MERRYVRRTALWTVGLILATTASKAADWRQWGGPTRDFKVKAEKLADSWGENGPKRLWSRALGPGYSSISVADGKVITMYRKGDEDVIVALNADTGKRLWEHSYKAAALPDQRLDFGTGPNSSPLVLDDRLITIGFTQRMNCLSLDAGKVLWSHDLIKEYGGKIQEFGYASSPILYNGLIIVLVGGEQNGVIAFHPADGSVAWKSGPYDISYASPIVINVDGQDQLVFMASTEVIALAADGGTFLWKYPCVNRYKNNATQPIWGDDHLLWVATQQDGGTRVLKLSQTAGKTKVEELWSSNKVKVFHWNAIRIGDYVYASIGGSSTRIAAVDVKTGRIAWRQSGFHKAQCLYADKKLLFLDENGQLVLAKVSPEQMKILSQVQLTEKVSWTVPTLVGKTLYVRDQTNIMALDLG